MIHEELARQIALEFPHQFTPAQWQAVQALSEFVVTPVRESAFILRGYAGTGKTTLVGALVRVLASFAESGLNMSRIESRPMPETPFQYFFSADFEGSMDAEHLSRAMEAARPYTCELRLLGVYPKAIPPKRENEANNS